MKTTKIKIKNLFGITETELDGSSIEITGKKGTGKTSVIDSIRYALTNASDRDYIVKNGMMKDLRVLTGSPFNDRGSVADVFTDVSIWSGIMKVIERINENAKVA